ncbi:MAG: glucose-6-phosphate dehydrogenase assembly protein OpcA, partial [Bdellovibrionales bacterium]|nr:glucose-6-phosphate dehydrogenase assembly protein OpcA [Bdellovibrionales bacterium]
MDSERVTASGRIIVPPNDVRSELARIWSETAERDTASGGADAADRGTRVRSTLSNLLLVTDLSGDSAAGKAVDSLITELAISFPSRFFIINSNSHLGEQDALQTGVSSRCVLASNGSHVCSEEIYIDVAPKRVDLLPSLVLNLLVADVRADLVLLGSSCIASADSPGFNIVRALQDVGDRIVYDSACFANPVETWKLLFSDMQGATDLRKGSSFGASEGAAVNEWRFRDVNWRRLRRWRTLVREVFDKPSLLDALPQLQTVELEMGGTASAASNAIPADGLLLAAWIANSLQLQTGQMRRGAGVGEWFLPWSSDA